jgi:2-polyprenyl-6-hydroxyphenyl methylase/3-demethylubiquinone-9 3-methyltransferase
VSRIDRTRPVPPARFQVRTDWYDDADRAWWDETGPARLLHAMNPVRAGFYLNQLREQDGAVDGRVVLDAGCGGGLVAARLAEAGASVVGLDASLPSLAVAARAVPKRFAPVAGSLERVPLADASVDAVVAADVLEHVGDLPAVVAELARVLAPGGLLLFDTVNRTAWAWFVAIFGAERTVGLVPRGTHDWRLFIRPAELDRLMLGAGLAPVRVAGLVPRVTPALVARGLAARRADPPSWRVGRSRRASYLGCYRKHGERAA